MPNFAEVGKIFVDLDHIRAVAPDGKDGAILYVSGYPKPIAISAAEIARLRKLFHPEIRVWLDQPRRAPGKGSTKGKPPQLKVDESPRG